MLIEVTANKCRGIRSPTKYISEVNKLKLEQELNKYSKESLIKAIVNSPICIFRGRDILEDVISKEIDLLFKKQSELLKEKRKTLKVGMSAIETLKIMAEDEKRYKKYEEIERKIKNLQKKLYGDL